MPAGIDNDTAAWIRPSDPAGSGANGTAIRSAQRSDESPAFKATLAVATRIAAGIDAGAGDRTSPQQMFEARADLDGTRHRASATRSTRLEALKGDADPRLDRTGVDARMATQGDQATSSNSPANAQPGPSARRVTSRAKGSGSMLHDETATASPLAPAAPPRSAPISAGLRVSAAEGRLQRTPSNPAGESPSVPTRSMSGGMPASSSALASARSVGPTQEGGGWNPAHDIARLLTAAGVSENEFGQLLNGSASAAPAALRPQTAPQFGSDDASATARNAPTPGPSDASRPQDVAEPLSFNEIVRSMRLNVGTKRSTANIRIEPPELGRLHVQVRMADDRLSVDILTQSDRATAKFHRRVEELKSALERHGIAVDRFEIRTHDATAQPALPSAMDARGQTQSENPAAGDPQARDGGESLVQGRDSVPAAVSQGIVDSGNGEWGVAERRLDLRV